MLAKSESFSDTTGGLSFSDGSVFDHEELRSFFERTAVICRALQNSSAWV